MFTALLNKDITQSLATYFCLSQKYLNIKYYVVYTEKILSKVKFDFYK